MKRFLALGVLFAMTAMPSFAEGLKNKIQVHGHRGCRAVYPENTLAAFNEALRAGVDVLEMDMQVTKDNVIVLSHEFAVSPDLCLAPGGEKITKQLPFHFLTLAEVKKFDCGTLRNPKFPDQTPLPGEKIPTLDEMFEMVKNSTYPAAANVQFNIETKIVPGYPAISPAPEEFAQLFADSIKKYGMEKRVILQSFDKRTLIAMKKLLPQVRTSMLTSDNLVPYDAVAQAIKADYISPDFLWITKADVDDLHKAGVQIVPWTVNTPADWDKMIELGVDGIITDNPGALISYLEKKGLR
ncbi:MAG: glycerophosphodiester phosphodiesterase [Elusimicrobiaceae bacterium]